LAKVDYDIKTNSIDIAGNRIHAYSLELNKIGNCSNCDGILISLRFMSRDLPQ